MSALCPRGATCSSLLSATKLCHCREDLKGYLVSIVIAVLAVLFLRQAVERADDFDLLKLSAALALMIVALVLFLSMRIHRKE
jgi:uncharacterized membrane protein YqhA